jgi:hypothetical protein
MILIERATQSILRQQRFFLFRNYIITASGWVDTSQPLFLFLSPKHQSTRIEETPQKKTTTTLTHLQSP